MTCLRDSLPFCLLLLPFKLVFDVIEVSRSHWDELGDVRLSFAWPGSFGSDGILKFRVLLMLLVSFDFSNSFESSCFLRFPLGCPDFFTYFYFK